MRHVLLLPLALLLVGVLPAAVQAQGVVGEKARNKPGDARAYWTDERKRDARPVEQVRGGGPIERGKPSKPGGGQSWTSGSVDFSLRPTAVNNGKVYFTENGTRYVCSGTAVTPTSGSAPVVWTAGHCVHGGTGGTFHSDWLFEPGYNSGTNYGSYEAVALYTTSQWAGSRQFGRDLGAVRVDLPFDSRLTPRTVDFSAYGPGTPVSAYGYPAAGKFNGQVQRYCDSAVSRMDAGPNPDAMAIPCDMTGGSSGGGWFNSDGLLISVNSYGYQSVKNTMFGPSQDGLGGVLAAASGTGPSTVVGR